MKRRNCAVVILEMIDKIPKHKVDFIEALNWNLNEASYKAPEENLQWIRTQNTLLKHIVKMEEDWEYEIISIFTTRPIEDLKNEVR
jgi:hypothetical protein